MASPLTYFMLVLLFVAVAITLYVGWGYVKKTPAQTSKVSNYRGNIYLISQYGLSVLNTKKKISEYPLKLNLIHHTMDGVTLPELKSINDASIRVINKGESYETWLLPGTSDNIHLKQVEDALAQTTEQSDYWQSQYNLLKSKFDEELRREKEALIEVAKSKAITGQGGFKK